MTEPLSPTLDDLPGPDHISAAKVRERALDVLRPAGALSRLDEVAAWLAGWQRTGTPSVASPGAAVFAADHGAAAAGVSAYPAGTTAEMYRALQAGVATASVMAEAVGVELRVFDVGVGRPTGDIAREPALSHQRFAECWQAGREAVADLSGSDLLVLGEMGIGNTTAAAALGAVLYGGTAETWTGRGSGVDERSLQRKISHVEQARRRVEGVDPMEALRQVGGAELVAMAAAAAEARARSIPIVLDGFVVTAACSVLEMARPGALDHCVAGHRSAEPGHHLLLEKLAKRPLLDLGLRLGEGSGALAAVSLVRLAAVCVTEVATFREWGLVE